MTLRSTSTGITAAGAATTTAPRLRRALGTPSLVLFGLVYMVPLTIFTTYGIVTELTGGRVSTAYAITLLAMAFTARSYARMAGAFPYAGSAYVYSQRSFGPGVGFLSGWALMLDYLFLPMINYLVIGIYLNAAFPAIPEWAFVLITIAVVSVLNIIGIVSIARVNFVIIAVQGIFIVAFIALSFGTISGGTADLAAPFTGDGSVGGVGVLFAGAALLALSFLGFDSISTLAEEAKDPVRSVPRAIMITTGIAGVMFIVIAWFSQMSFPSNEFSDVDAGGLDVMAAAGGEFLTIFFTAAYIAGATGSALTSQASVSRILYAMGRDGVLPRVIFGRISPRFQTPVTAILIVSGLSLFAVFIDLGLLVEMISFGALFAFSIVNLCVIKHYYIDRRERSAAALLSNLVLPLIGFVFMFWLLTSLPPRAFVVGVIWIAAGVVLLAVTTRGFRRAVPMLDLSEVATEKSDETSAEKSAERTPAPSADAAS